MGFRSRNWAQAASKARGRGEGVAYFSMFWVRIGWASEVETGRKRPQKQEVGVKGLRLYARLGLE
jgi:hypothetical protein